VQFLTHAGFSSPTSYSQRRIPNVVLKEKHAMPLTTLDPNTALIVIDLQKGIASGTFIHPIADIVNRTRALIDVFRANNLPVVLVNVAGRAPGRTEQAPRNSPTFAEGWTDLLPQLNRQPSDITVTKRSWGAFATTDLEAQLKTRGVTQVVVTGVATSVGVESTARQAYEQGFNLTLALDAMTDIREEAHDYSIKNVFPRLGETGSTHEIIAQLENSLFETRSPA
jgi:nicotinamidase-related amidase